jgi:hypothetical protein
MINNNIWSTVNPTATIVPVSRKFYGQYYYKITIKSPEVQDIVSGLRKGQSSDIVLAEAKKRRNWRNSYNNTYTRSFTGADEQLLMDLTIYLTAQSPPVKMRVERDNLACYFVTEQEAEKFTKSVSPQVRQKIETISVPDSEQSLRILAKDLIILKRETPYRFLVTIREGRYQIADTKRLLTYLKNVDAKVSAGLAEKLNGTFADRVKSTRLAWQSLSNIVTDTYYFNGIRFYLKEEAEVSWLHLTWPGKIGKIQQVVYAGKYTEE